MNKKKIRYRVLQITVIILFALSGLVYGVNKVWMKHTYFDGFALGMAIMSLGIGGFLFYKRKDEDFKEDLEYLKHDERLKVIRLKRHAIMHKVILTELIILTTFSVFYNLSFKTGAGILLYTDIIGFGILWLYDRRK